MLRPFAMEARPLCDRCRRPLGVCFCALVQPVRTRTRVLLLQHPRERDVPVNTARMAALALPEATLRVGVDFTRDALVQGMVTDRALPAVVLFPSEDATDLRASPPDGPVTLVVIDGTWSQARAMVRHNPWLRALPRYRLDPAVPSRYGAVRREPDDTSRATLEALAEALSVLEGDPSLVPTLLAPLEALVETQLRYAREGKGRPARRVRALERPRHIPTGFLGDPSRLVLACGETNAWTVEDAPGPPEVLHWTALRVGERAPFEAVIAPRQALGPSTATLLQLPEERLRGGLSLDAFRAHWTAFTRPGDTLVVWGEHCTRAWGREAVALPPVVDLRRVAGVLRGGPPGSVEDCARAFGERIPEPVAGGRAGGRLAALEAVALHLLAEVSAWRR
ncbi:MAG: DTW domain-containing protein [Deltaproteobacteria bacterium]|nr:DTW domain-containing protein [Deltaproteobacteria bacterium]